MIKTKITEFFGIEYPIICGAMMWLCTPRLCAAISEAGAMGNLTSGCYESEEAFRSAINEIRKYTDKPFFVGLTSMPSVRITAELNKMYIRVCAEEHVPAMEISGPALDIVFGMEYIELLKDAGVKIFHKLGTVKHALHAQKVGYDGVFCVGYEAGGHPHHDNVTSMVLIPTMVKALEIPVIAVGGIADGCTLAAALALGAEGVMMASRFIATWECDVHGYIKHELIKKQEFDTTLFGAESLGIQGRSLKNKLIEDILEIEKNGGGLIDILPLVDGDRIKEAWKNGNADNALLMVGQSIAHINKIMSCKEVVRGMGDDAKKHFQRLNSLI